MKKTIKGIFLIGWYLLFLNVSQTNFAAINKSISKQTSTQNSASSSLKNASQTKLSEEEALFIAVDAYIFGYPLITIDLIKKVMTNTKSPHGEYAPVGQFIHLREFPSPQFVTVTAPNVDMLYSFAWLDLTNDAYVLHLPNLNGRYYVMPIIDAWTEVIASLGSRTTGTGAHDFLITGPKWAGNVPIGMQQIKSSTSIVWIKGRTYTDGSLEDLEKVHQIQDQYQLTPLKYYKQKYTAPQGHYDPSIDMQTPIRKQVDSLNSIDFFNRLSILMKENPPYPADQSIMERLAKIKIIPGEKLASQKLDPIIQNALKKSIPIAQKKINAHLELAGSDKNGWRYMYIVGKYGTDYLQRALMAAIQPGATIPVDLLYPVTALDSDGNDLTGEKYYLLRFLNGQMPPVNGFWSLTLYDENYNFVPNQLNRYSINQRNKLHKNWMGTTEIYIQKDSPGTKRESNWLPAPNGKFILMFRLYWPKEETLEGVWLPPRVKKIIKL